ncbi:MAG TPA: LysR family transcriptional regulator [Anaeromyxobacteraceae bacterium]|nr:LysR family transcriptional regulator [Anaeromyxobacteraceae bacterium]
MDLRTLHTFRVAARTLSFTQAAAALSYAQSSVTAQMKVLEESLGVPLFDRIGHRLQLTPPGERLLAYADRLLALAEEAKAAVRSGEPTGALALTAPESVCTYLLPALFCRFRESYPAVRLRFVPLPVREFKRALLDATVDAAFILEEPFARGSLRLEHLREEPLAVVAHPSHRLAARPSVVARDLVGETVLLTEVGCSYRNLFERSLIHSGAHPGPRMDFQSIEAIKRCVEAGLGIAALPRMAVAGEIEDGRLAALSWRGPRLSVATQLAWSEGRWMSPALEAFVHMAREVLGGLGQPDRAAGSSRADPA